jgi:hypothetical protein
VPALELWVAESAALDILGLLGLGGDRIDQLDVDPELTGQRARLARWPHPGVASCSGLLAVFAIIA